MRARYGMRGRGKFTAPPSDFLDTVLAGLADKAWSNNFAQNNIFATGYLNGPDNTPNSAWALRYSANPSVVGDIPIPYGNSPFAYGSGRIDSANNRYFLGAGGGHMDGCGSECFFFQFATGLWQLTQKSARYAKSLATVSSPFQAHTPSYDRWKVFRNADNEWVPASTHLYAGIELCGNLGFWVQGMYVFCADGNGDAGGGALVDRDTGKFIEASGWDCGGSIFSPAGGDATRTQTHDQPGFAPGMYGDCQNFWLPNINRLWRWSTSTQLNEDYQAWRMDLTNKTREAAGQRGGGGGPGIDQYGASMGVVIPDPFSPGYKGCLSLAQGGPLDGNGNPTPHQTLLCLYREIDKLGSNQVAGRIQTSNNRPSLLRGNARPFYLGDMFPSVRKVAFFNPTPGTATWAEIYTLDIGPVIDDPVNGRAVWNTTPITLSNPPVQGGQPYRQLEYHASKNCFVMIGGQSQNGAAYALRCPTELMS